MHEPLLHSGILTHSPLNWVTMHLSCAAIATRSAVASAVLYSIWLQMARGAHALGEVTSEVLEGMTGAGGWMGRWVDWEFRQVQWIGAIASSRLPWAVLIRAILASKYFMAVSLERRADHSPHGSKRCFSKMRRLRKGAACKQ